MSLKTRLDRVQAEYQRRTIAAMAAAQGLTYEELLEEASAFLALPLAVQLDQVDAIAAELQAEGLNSDDVEEIKATLTREYRPR
jgi:molybdate-binding protein